MKTIRIPNFAVTECKIASVASCSNPENNYDELEFREGCIHLSRTLEGALYQKTMNDNGVLFYIIEDLQKRGIKYHDIKILGCSPIIVHGLGSSPYQKFYYSGYFKS